MDIPQNLSHKPIVAVDYEDEDVKAGAGDALFLSIGEATWNKSKTDENLDYSAKVFRWVEANKHWSSQSEELPLWRVIDLATFLIAVINDHDCEMTKEIVDKEKYLGLRQFIEKEENKKIYQEKITRLMNTINK